MNASRALVSICLISVLVAGFVSVATAAKKPSGQDLYKEYCKPCHEADSEHGEYTPLTLIQDQWTRFFEEKYVDHHADVMDPKHDNTPVTEVISDEDLELIKEFAIEHAADSEHPMTCG